MILNFDKKLQGLRKNGIFIPSCFNVSSKMPMEDCDNKIFKC